ncbi:MAG: GNAT family N-acetyltransferase [Elusimicrobia bacterium]|nr:GNAT family N-acetyltransferase [Elusimicrobiota bacterium]
MVDPFDDPTLTMSRATAADAERVAELLRSAYAVHAARGLNFRAATATPAQVGSRIKRHDVYVLRRAGRIVGTVALRTKEDVAGVTAYVSALAVDPNLQHGGLGGAILERAEHEAVRRGFARMRLDTAKPALDIVGFYERRGYCAVDEVHWEGKTYDTVVMEKKLPVPANLVEGQARGQPRDD